MNTNLRDFDVWYAWSGQGELCIDGHRHAISPGSLFCFFPGSSVVGSHDPKHPLGVTYVHFDATTPAARTTLHMHLESRNHSRVRDVEWVERLARRTVDLAKRNQPIATQAAETCLKALLNEMILAAADTTSAMPTDADRTIREIAESIREAPGSLNTVSDLAERAGYQVDHFTGLFKRVIGISPKEYCIRIRIERAKALLSESTMSIGAIAVALGYADVFFFSRQFTQRAGMTPSRWRKRE